MTTRGTMPLVCLCLLSAGLLVITQASSVRPPVRGERFLPIVDQGESVAPPVADAASVGLKARKRAASVTIPPFPSAGRFRTDTADARQPGRLPSANGAAPLIPDPAQTAALRELIRREMPHASPSEIDIWVRKWQGMSLHSVRTMLEMRRAMPLRPRATDPPPFAPQPIPMPSLPTVVGPPDGSGPTHPSRVGPERPRLSPVPSAEPTPVDPSLVALRQARDVILNNIANAGTPGFKRCRAVLSDLQHEEPQALTQPDEPASLLSIGGGMRVAAIQRDWSPGKLVKTGRKLDFAIDGTGFFVVRRGKQRAFTRKGNFERDADGSLVLAADRRWRVETASLPRKLENKLTLSLGVRTDPFKRPRENRKLELPVLPGALAPFTHAGMEVDIKPTGKHRPAKAAASMPLVAAVANPDGLQPLGNGLFAETPASGPARIQPSKSTNVGKIQSGFLEASNVDTKRELAELRQLAGQIQALRMADDVLKQAEPKPAPPGPVVEKPGGRRMSGRVPLHQLRIELDQLRIERHDGFIPPEGYRVRGPLISDPVTPAASMKAKPQPMAPPPKRGRTRMPVTPASLDDLDSWEYPIEIEILFLRKSASGSNCSRAAG